MQNKLTILVVEDDTGISNFIHVILDSNGYEVLTAKTGADAMMLATSRCPDLILLDLGLPDMDGDGIIRSIRSWSAIPIIVVSARSHEKDKVEALDLGADDYVTKPFGSAELLARIRTALRHTESRTLGPDGPSGCYKAGALTIDYDTRRAFLSGVDIHLTQTEFRIVARLAKYGGRVLTYDQIIKAVWGPNSGSDTQILRVNMAHIRRKLEVNPAEPQYIFTEMGVGYRLIEGD